LNIPIKSPRRFQDIKITRNRTRTVPQIPTVKQKKIEKSRKSKIKKPIKNKNKGRKPKQFEEDRKRDDVKGDFAEDQEPTPEPEPTGGHHGDPRHHAFHSWLYQKIDPKVREARRKKFFGSGRRRRSTVDEDFREVHLDSEPRQEKERDGAARINHHGFHSYHYQVIDATWRERRRMMPGSEESKVRDKRESERISINLGVQLSEDNDQRARSDGGHQAD